MADTCQMEAILLAWNPRNFRWGGLREELALVKRDGRAPDRWSVGNRKHIAIGTRFFLVRLGSEPRGLVGSGRITSTPFEAPHWSVDKAKIGRMARYVSIDFDTLDETPLVSMEELAAPPFSEVHWSTQISGVRIPEHIVTELESLWRVRTHTDASSGREEFDDPAAITEGHASRVYVNRYERSARARALCLAKHGNRCAACNALLVEVYGRAAASLVHVHHLKPLAEIPGEYTIDPVRDLRPVCPNCHAVIHSQTPPYTIEEVAVMLGQHR